jgi:hypothetical protein
VAAGFSPPTRQRTTGSFWNAGLRTGCRRWRSARSTPNLLERNKRRIASLVETGKVKKRDPDYRPAAGTMLTREYQGR